MTALALALGLGGLLLGLLADRLAVRWPAHDPPFEAGRPPGWRTAVAIAFGAGSLGLLGQRFGLSLDLFVVGAYVCVLIVLLATDLDQRLLPDVLTLPLVVYTAVIGVLGLNPYVDAGLRGMLGPLVMAIAVPIAVYVPSIPFGPGAIALGDIKLLVSMGLLLGFPRELLGLFGAGVVVIVVLGSLLALRRIGRRTYVPFGPFLILAAVWAILLPQGSGVL